MYIVHGGCVQQVSMLFVYCREDSLHIYSVLASDEGVYYCTAENLVGSVTGSVSLIVHGEFSRFLCT